VASAALLLCEKGGRQRFYRTRSVALSDAELNKHFREQAQLIGMAKTGTENLTAAISDEYLETARIYPDMAKRAEEAGDSTAAKHFAATAADEGKHRQALRAIVGKLAGGGAAN
jgi:rubrerythrin